MVNGFAAQIAAAIEIPRCVVGIYIQAIFNRMSVDFFVTGLTTVPEAKVTEHDDFLGNRNVKVHALIVKMLVILIGPEGAGFMSETSDLYRILSLVGDAAYYYFPVFAAYSSAKKY